MKKVERLDELFLQSWNVRVEAYIARDQYHHYNPY